MTRGSLRFMLVLGVVIATPPFVLIGVQLNEPWDPSKYLLLAALLVDMALFGYLLFVRHHDAHFWDEEEARRADFDRRGRRL